MDSLEALNSRSSAKTYGENAPSKEELAIVLQAAVRAPDHGRLRPWRFMLIQGDQRRKFGDILAVAALRRTPGLSEGDLQRERDKALRAPLIIVVACRTVSGTKVPVIEQILPQAPRHRTPCSRCIHSATPPRGKPAMRVTTRK